MSDLIDFFQLWSFWSAVGWDKVLRFFWFFFIFEATRYIALDFIVLIAYRASMYYRHDANEHARRQLFAERPLISVIAPGRNEGEHIYRLVKSLEEQTYRNLEIIIVDDGSDDHTPLICRSLHRNGLIHKYFRNAMSGGKASAANLALRYASGKFVVHLDADSSYDRNAIERIVLPFYINPSVGAVGGNIKVRNHDDNVCTRLQAIEYMKVISIGRLVASRLGIYRIVPGAFGAFRRDLLERLKGWDVGPGMDGDITVKIRKLGYKIDFEPRAVCFTNVPRSYSVLARQRLRWSRSLVRFRIRKHRDVYFGTKNFRFKDFFSFAENIFYYVILDFKWFIYIVDILYNYPTYAKFLLPMNYFLYVGSNFLQFTAVMLLSDRKREDLRLALYLPLMPLYTGLYIRTVRTLGYCQEFFFRKSYLDPWNPWRVSRKAREKGI